MKMFDNNKYYEILNILNAKVPYEHSEYFNMCLASGVAEGREINENKIMKLLLNGVDDGFISYTQALALNKIYVGMIDKLNYVRG